MHMSWLNCSLGIQPKNGEIVKEFFWSQCWSTFLSFQFQTCADQLQFQRRQNDHHQHHEYSFKILLWFCGAQLLLSRKPNRGIKEPGSLFMLGCYNMRKILHNHGSHFFYSSSSIYNNVHCHKPQVYISRCTNIQVSPCCT